ncbi:MAG: helix-hairpin-helix domain-containing protein, partial [Candidatus Cloacimonadota bacterium]|nr:helix-hairpin-helix domain-containing protein [Candidatus Cloacimonadota bacterium]
NCPAQIQRKLEHFASREAMDIYGLGSSLIARLIETGQIKWIPDIYHLDYNKIAEMERMGKKSADNLQKAIEASKTKNFDRVLFALGIRHIGSITARTLAQHFKNIDALIMAKEEELLSVPDIGSIVARSIIGFFSQKSNRELIDSLRKVGLQFTYISPQSSAILAGKTFLITGTLPNYSRKDMETLITEHGGKILSGVSKQLNYLIVGENPGSKLDKARQLGTVKIISEAELLDMLQ